jgi:hypothetical protein
MNSSSLGGAKKSSAGDPAKNRMNAIGVAGSLEWLLAGPILSPAQNYLGLSGTRHLSFFEYAIAPGDQQGYLNDGDRKNKDSVISISKRDENARALAFNKNFTPALILFNGRSEIDTLKIDGIFDPKRVMNAQVYSLGYRLETKDYGNLESKLVTAKLIQSPSDEVKAYHASKSSKPIGYYGKSLGYELDIKYSKSFPGGLDLGFAAGALIPGLAWQTKEDQKPLNSYILQTHLVYNF